MRTKTFILFLNLLGYSLFYAQDLIIENNGRHHYCKISREDSLHVYFLEEKSETKVILKDSIKSYYFNKYQPQIPVPARLPVEPKSSVSIYAGPSVPIGVFGSSDYSQGSSGLAQTGYFINCIIRRMLSNNFGLQ